MPSSQRSLFPDYRPESLFSLEDISAILKPHLNALRDCWIGAFWDWHNLVPGETRALLGGLSRANCMNDFAKHRITTDLASIEGIDFNNMLGFFKMMIGAKVVARFKKIKDDGTAMNSHTEQQRLWYNNEPIIGIPNSCCRITVGCLLSPDGEAISDVRITHQLSWDQVDWMFSLLDGSALPIPIQTRKSGMPPISIIPVDDEDGQIEEAM